MPVTRYCVPPCPSTAWVCPVARMTGLLRLVFLLMRLFIKIFYFFCFCSQHECFKLFSLSCFIVLLWYSFGALVMTVVLLPHQEHLAREILPALNFILRPPPPLGWVKVGLHHRESTNIPSESAAEAKKSPLASPEQCHE